MLKEFSFDDLDLREEPTRAERGDADMVTIPTTYTNLTRCCTTD
jgi:hypothetical protein